MPITISVLYRQTPDLKLDLQSFLEDHAPKVIKAMGPYGLKAVRALELKGSPTTENGNKEYALQVEQDWDSVEAFQKALDAVGEELTAHISTFINHSPLIMYGDVILNKTL